MPGEADYFLPGAWNFRCQECGKKLKSTEGRQRWDNLWVGPECFEFRNPQDFVRGIPDDSSVPWSTGDPQPAEVVISVNRVIDGAILNTQTID